MPPFYIPTDRIEYKKSPNLYNPLSLAFGDPYAEDVVLYLKGDGANLSKSYIDSSPSGGNTITGNASSYITTAEKKYGTASIYRSNVFSMSGANLFFNTGDFTVEFWIRGISLSDNNYRSIITIGGAILFAYGNPMYLRIGSTDHITPFNHNITSTQWAHIAMVQGR
jgi:hypothetical protein